MTQDKRVDESWKESVQKEKKASVAPGPAAQTAAVDFSGFVSMLAMQAMMALGEMAHPETGQKTQDIAQARYLIDTLQLLADKTKGNLSAEESEGLKTLLYELRVKFVKINQEVA